VLKGPARGPPKAVGPEGAIIRRMPPCTSGPVGVVVVVVVVVLVVVVVPVGGGAPVVVVVVGRVVVVVVVSWQPAASIPPMTMRAMTMNSVFLFTIGLPPLMSLIFTQDYRCSSLD
jgi:hypothetical protein